MAGMSKRRDYSHLAHDEEGLMCGNEKKHCLENYQDTLLCKKFRKIHTRMNNFLSKKSERVSFAVYEIRQETLNKTFFQILR